MVIGNIIIRTSKSVRKQLEKSYATREEQYALYSYCVGIYSCRMLGLCIYRVANERERLYAQLEKTYYTNYYMKS